MFEERFKSWLLAVMLKGVVVVLMISWYFLSFILATSYEDFNPYINATSTYKLLPFDTYFPFDISLSHGYFWYAFLLQLVVETLPAYTYLGVYLDISIDIMNKNIQIV